LVGRARRVPDRIRQRDRAWALPIPSTQQAISRPTSIHSAALSADLLWPSSEPGVPQPRLGRSGEGTRRIPGRSPLRASWSSRVPARRWAIRPVPGTRPPAAPGTPRRAELGANHWTMDARTRELGRTPLTLRYFSSRRSRVRDPSPAPMICRPSPDVRPEGAPRGRASRRAVTRGDEPIELGRLVQLGHLAEAELGIDPDDRSLSTCRGSPQRIVSAQRRLGARRLSSGTNLNLATSAADSRRGSERSPRAAPGCGRCATASVRGHPGMITTRRLLPVLADALLAASTEHSRHHGPYSLALAARKAAT
jgi:hypothetical protein